MDEPSLIYAAQHGDLDAFNRLVLAYQNLAYTQAYRVMGESDAAEDATQNAFIAAYQKLNTYRGGSFRAWLLRIVTNTCIDEIRRTRRQPTVPLEPVDDYGEEVESPHWSVDPGELPEDGAVRAELRRAIEHCLADLPLEFRTVVVLVDVQGMDYAEAADAVQTPIGTVRSRLSRARTRLQNCLRGFWELLPASYRLQGES